MPDLNWNETTWGSAYDWQQGGEEWSQAWGGSEAQWFGAIFPRLHRFLPAQRILEIAPGFGRWTKFLIPACREFVGIDLAERCTSACNQRFAAAGHARFFTNDGFSLKAAPDRSFDLVFSFDSLVHAEYEVMASYIPQVLHKLSPTGVAFLHHSNLLTYKNTLGVPHGRALSVSADLVADLINRNGGKVLVQEVVNWGGEHLIDCLSLFTTAGAYPSAEAVRLNNPVFMGEATIIQSFQSRYSRHLNAHPVNKPDLMEISNPSTMQENATVGLDGKAPHALAADGIKLYIGDKKKHDGWMVLDISPSSATDFPGDCRQLSSFADESCSEVYASHVLQRLGHDRELATALTHIHRILKPGGRFRVSVPDFEALCQQFLDPSLDGDRRFQVMRTVFGDRATKDDVHNVGLTFEFLSAFLHEVGFREIRRVPQFGLFDDASKMFFADVPISLNVETQK